MEKSKFYRNVRLFWILSCVGIMSLFVIVYTWSKKIEADSHKTASTYASLYSMLFSNNIDDDARSLIFDEVIVNSVIPMIITDVDSNVQAWRNIPVSQERTDANISKAVYYSQLLNKKNAPIPLIYSLNGEKIKVGHLHFGNISSLGFFNYLPVLIFGLAMFFAYASFAGFGLIKDNEQNKVFCGLAKETAHQLGTPLSSLWGWIELVKIDSGYNIAVENRKARRKMDLYIEEMEKDIRRLEKVNNRFELIGSPPEKELFDLNEIITEIAVYMKNRLPHHIEIRTHLEQIPKLVMNKTLIEWVVENLLKNSIDVLNSEKSGLIEIHSFFDSTKKEVVVNFIDNGKGIRERDKKRIFEAGYSTKKSGWGLGLTLVKRIVEVFHNGSIVLVESKPFVSTFFQIRFKT